MLGVYAEEYQDTIKLTCYFTPEYNSNALNVYGGLKCWN